MGASQTSTVHAFVLVVYIGTGCASLEPPVVDPEMGRFALGFSARGMGMLRWDGSGEAEVSEVILPRGPTSTVAATAASDLAAAMRWARSVADRAGWISQGSPPPTDLVLQVQRRGGVGGEPSAALIADSGGWRVTLAPLPGGSARQLRLTGVQMAPDGRHAVATIDRDGVRSLYVVDMGRAQAMRLNAEALAAYGAGDLIRAASRWEAAHAADPRFGDAIYNLACVHARRGDLERAGHELAVALAIDPLRYRRLARRDADLEGLRASTAGRRQLGLPSVDPND